MTATAMTIAAGSGVDRVAVIGGGINGAGIAWELARRGYEVVLFEKGEFGKQTSSATTKMIHGGLRYLENRRRRSSERRRCCGRSRRTRWHRRATKSNT
jgi:glycerol-3-phosphate dehydrogenase